MKHLIIILIFGNIAVSNVPDSLNKPRLYSLAGLTTAGFVTSQIIQYDVYWSDRSNFTVMDLQTEYDDALLADKFGHHYISYAMSKVYSKALEWTGMVEESRAWWGAGVSLFHQTYVEINDGFSKGEPYLGFSIGDNIANIAGAGWPIMQYYYPILEEINFKINFIESQSFAENQYANISNDYESTYHWVTIDVFEMLNANDGYWGFLQLAVGHSVKNIDRNGAGNHEFYLGLDINWKHFLNYEFVQNNYYLQLIVEILDKYRFPLPSFKFHPNFVGYGFRG